MVRCIETRIVMQDDLPVVLEMAHALAAHHGDQATVTLQDLERDMLGNAPWLTVLVAELDGKVAGYGALCPLAQVQFGVRGMDMHHLYVAPEARRKGVGVALIKASEAEAKAQHCRYIMVGTHPDNAAAQEVYRAAGFDDAPQAGPRFRIKW